MRFQVSVLFSLTENFFRMSSNFVLGLFFISAFFDLLLLCVFPTHADGFDAFLESAGGCFDQEVAGRVRKFIYSAGNSRDPAEAYRLFRGRYTAYFISVNDVCRCVFGSFSKCSQCNFICFFLLSLRLFSRVVAY